ncbi:MAG: TIGR02996 domain-containing protein [Kofleriaceae bacterium]
MSFEAEDPQEAELMGALRANPSDDATRQVYADWLEQRGYTTRATFLRLDGVAGSEEPALRRNADPVDFDWRAAISNPPISRCGVRFGFECTKRWEALERTDDDAVRHCSACEKPVYFVASVEEAEVRGRARECVAIDAAVPRTTALSKWDAVQPPRQNVMKMGMVAVSQDPMPIVEPVVSVPPPPPPFVEKPGLLKRVAGWFRR